MAADFIRIVNRASGGTVPTLVNRAKIITIVKTGAAPAAFTVQMDGATSVVVNVVDATNIIGGDAVNL